MASSLTPQKSRTTIFTQQVVQSNSIAKSGAPVDVSGKLGGMLKVRMGRTTTTSIGSSLPEFRLEGQSKGHGGADDGWVQIIGWAPSLGATAAAQQNVTSTPAAGASALDGTWTGITQADGMVFIHDTNDASRSEWARVLSVTTSALTFDRTLTNIHTLTTNKVVDQAEEWSIPVDFQGEESVRFVVDTAKAGTPVPIVVAAVLVTTDAIYAS